MKISIDLQSLGPIGEIVGLFGGPFIIDVDEAVYQQPGKIIEGQYELVEEPKLLEEKDATSGTQEMAR